jgi:tRNA pseudouridine38-40 synthase
VARFKLTIEYAGTRYRGWQVQANARTVQGEIQRVVREVSGRTDFSLYGSGRTDAGVHALGQVAHLDLETRLSADALSFALNDGLPADINVLAAEKVPRQFHARHGAVGRIYLYQVSRRRTAFGKPFVWWVRDALDVARMRVAAAAFVGTRDFRSFTDDDPEEKSTKVKLEALDIAEEGALVLFRVRGSHFLWKMVRRLVGVLVDVGRDAMSPWDVPALLTEMTGRPAELTAPPSGLFLEAVLYPGDRFERPLRSAVAVDRGSAPAPPEGTSPPAPKNPAVPKRGVTWR